MSQESEKSLFRHEPLEEWFFKSPVRLNGQIIPAPNEAVALYKRLKDEWLKKHPKTKEVPSVSLCPVCKDGEEGYIVRKEIIYP